MVQLELNARNLLMALTHTPAQLKPHLEFLNQNIENLTFRPLIGTFRDSKLSRGDLGNQLFQVSAAMAYAWFHNGKVAIEDPTPQNGIKLDCFVLDGISIISKEDTPTKIITEDNFCITEAIECEKFFTTNFDNNDIVNLEGYFQNWRFAQIIEQNARKAFTFKKSFEEFATNILNKVRLKFPGRKIVAVHYRAYDQNESKGYSVGSEINHPPIPFEYYINAINKMDSSADNPPIYLIISNSANSAKEAFGKNPRFVYSEDFIDSEDKHIRTDNDTLSTLSAPVDLCLMSKCDGHIISNSTFSWWGAWLSGNHDVVAPSRCRWFGEHLGTHNLTDLYYPLWKEVWFPPHPKSFVTWQNFETTPG